MVGDSDVQRGRKPRLGEVPEVETRSRGRYVRRVEAPTLRGSLLTGDRQERESLVSLVTSITVPVLVFLRSSFTFGSRSLSVQTLLFPDRDLLKLLPESTQVSSGTRDLTVIVGYSGRASVEVYQGWWSISSVVFSISSLFDIGVQIYGLGVLDTRISLPVTKRFNTSPNNPSLPIGFVVGEHTVQKYRSPNDVEMLSENSVSNYMGKISTLQTQCLLNTLNRLQDIEESP